MNTQTTEKNLGKCKCCYTKPADRIIHVRDEAADALCYECANYVVLLISNVTNDIIKESFVVRSTGPATVFNH